MEKYKLKPCPCCASEMSFKSTLEELQESGYFTIDSIECQKCGLGMSERCSGKPHNIDLEYRAKQRAELADRWNTRLETGDSEVISRFLICDKCDNSTMPYDPYFKAYICRQCGNRKEQNFNWLFADIDDLIDMDYPE